MSQPPLRVCILMMSAVGDAVHVLPVINAIKRARPSSRITWVLQSVPATLIHGHESVDEVIIFDRSKGVAGMKDVIGQLRERKFDLLLDLQVYFKAGVITAFSGAPRRIGFNRARARDANWLFTNERIPPHPIQHVQDQYFEFLRYLDIDPEPVEWRIGPYDSEREWQHRFVSRFTRPLASIVVGTSKQAKDWIPERWAQVSDILSDRYGMQSILVGGNSEREIAAAETILARSKSNPHSALGSGLRNLISILDSSELALAGDTGPLHMSVALDRPIIALMGYTDPRRTGPYRKFHDLLIDAYHDPGETGPITMNTRHDRMSRITVDDVAARLEIWNARYRGKS